MSRICVKNIPKYVGEDRLKEFFSQKGEITDAKIMRTKDWKSRQFAFIGFRTEEEAEEAIRFFNNSYMDTCRITCEVARKVGDPDIPRPWSKHSIKKDNTQNGNNMIKKDDKPDASSLEIRATAQVMGKTSKVSDGLLEEFLQVMQPRVKSKLWANDTPGASFSTDHDKISGKGSQSRELGKMQLAKIEAATSHIGEDADFDLSASKRHIADGALETSTNKMGAARDDSISDMDYFKSRVKKSWSDTESDDESADGVEREEIDEKDPITQREEIQIDMGDQPNGIKESVLENHEGVGTDNEKPSSAANDENEQALDTGRLFVRNLPYTTNEDELLELFSKFGDVSNVHLVVDKDTKRSKGIGYVLYTLPECAVRALEELDNSIFQGRLLHVLPAKPQNPSTNKSESNLPSEQHVKNFKQQREQQKKTSEISGDTKSWNSLFMRPDTVVENIARKYGVSKSDLLDREADDLAVRIALGETHVIAESKKYLSNAGVNVATLEELASKTIGFNKRSNHVILVKNLPYGSCEGDLAKMFGQFGSLDKIILPPTKALALVIFLEPAEARTAFKSLAYKRYKDAPLYLEWAPSDILSPKTTTENDEQKNVIGEKEIKRVLIEQTVEGVSEVDLDPDRVESRSVFVKNLNFKTSDESLRNHFNDIMKKGIIQSVKIKKHVKNGKNVSMGYGFIEFDSVETATDICRDLQGTVLDGHALILQLCHSKKDGQAIKKADKDRSTTKIIVRNVAFEATEKDLRQLFSPFGQIKSVRLPMKFGSHRGFAFVEYITKQEAQNALQALANTHLYGRHLVLERAKEGESLEELRARTAAQFSVDQDGLQKLSKKRKNTSLLDGPTAKFERIMD